VNKETAIAVAVSVVAVATMAIDHLIGTSDPNEPGFEDPGAFVLSVALALALVVLLFGRVVRRAVRDEPEESTLKAVAFSLLAVLTLPLLFLAVLFPFAVVVGAFVLALGAVAYLTALAA
jgi:hypothetical protein